MVLSLPWIRRKGHNSPALATVAEVIQAGKAQKAPRLAPREGVIQVIVEGLMKKSHIHPKFSMQTV